MKIRDRYNKTSEILKGLNYCISKTKFFSNKEVSRIFQSIKYSQWLP